jgi:hypothetical protein
MVTSEERFFVNRQLLLKFVGSTFLTQVYHGLGTGITSSDATPESHIFFVMTVQLKRLGRAGRVSETLQAAQAAGVMEDWRGVTIVIMLSANRCTLNSQMDCYGWIW